MSKFILRTWDRPARWLIKHRRWWVRNVNPLGPSEERVTESGELRWTEAAETRVTEGT